MSQVLTQPLLVCHLFQNIHVSFASEILVPHSPKGPTCESIQLVDFLRRRKIPMLLCHLAYDWKLLGYESKELGGTSSKSLPDLPGTRRSSLEAGGIPLASSCRHKELTSPPLVENEQLWQMDQFTRGPFNTSGSAVAQKTEKLLKISLCSSRGGVLWKPKQILSFSLILYYQPDSHALNFLMPTFCFNDIDILTCHAQTISCPSMLILLPVDSLGG